ncbi:phage late control D family protein [Methylobacterium sp. D53M]
MPGRDRSPRGFLRVGGAIVEATSIEVHLTREAKSNSAHAVLAMSGLPEGRDLAYWCDTPQIEVAFAIGANPDETEVIFTGSVTTVRPDWFQRRINLDCHDKSKKMMESRALSQTFRNKKGKDVASEVAKKHGVTVEGGDDTAVSGRRYNIDAVHHPRDLTDWDLLNYIADAEGLDAVLDGDTLYLDKDGDTAGPVLEVEYTEPTEDEAASGTSITLAGVRNLDLTGKTTVKVKSHDHRTKKQVEGKKTLAAATGVGKNGNGITYEYQAPGLKQDRASRIAEKRLRRATKQERAITLNLPGDTKIRARMRTRLSGTGTSFDQDYDNESVEHRLNNEEGYRCLVTAKAASKGRAMSDE